MRLEACSRPGARDAMWIKICGNTNLEDALFAAESGANALGFVFAESPRRVSVQQVRNITAELPAEIARIGVFVDASFDEIVTAVLECGLTGVQLHTCSDETLPGRLRSYFAEGLGGGRLAILRVLHAKQGTAIRDQGSEAADLEARLAALGQNPAVDAVLVDSRTAKAVGGTGVAFDWQAAREGFVRAGVDLNLVLAGGLNPENISQAIETLRPWGVDVVTGVEASPGRKDPAKVQAFIQNARVAAMKIAAPIRG